MDAATETRLAELIGGASPVRVTAVRMEHYPMTSSLVRERFATARRIEINEHGMGAEQRDGTWLWVEATTQPGGTR